MQVHGPSEQTTRVHALLNTTAAAKPFGVLRIGSVEVFAETAGEARLLHRATGELVRLMEDAGLS